MLCLGKQGKYDDLTECIVHEYVGVMKPRVGCAEHRENKLRMKANVASASAWSCVTMCNPTTGFTNHQPHQGLSDWSRPCTGYYLDALPADPSVCRTVVGWGRIMLWAIIWRVWGPRGAREGRGFGTSGATKVVLQRAATHNITRHGTIAKGVGHCSSAERRARSEPRTRWRFY